MSDFIPSGLSLNQFNSESEAGRAAGKKAGSDSILPGFARGRGAKNAVISALLGLTPGQQAAQQSVALGDPLGAFIAGAGAQINAPTPEQVSMQRQAQAAQAQFEQFNATPITAEDFPKLVERFPEIEGMPFGALHKISPMLNRVSQQEAQMERLLLRLRQMSELTELREGRKDSRQNVSETEKNTRLDRRLSSKDRESALLRDLIKGLNDETPLSGSAASVADKWGL